MRQKKEFHHNKIEKCVLTKESIDTTKEDYAILVECRGEEIKSIKFYKHKELLELIKGNVDKISEKLMGRTMGVAGNMLEKMGLMKKEVVIQ